MIQKKQARNIRHAVKGIEFSWAAETIKTPHENAKPKKI